MNTPFAVTFCREKMTQDGSCDIPQVVVGNHKMIMMMMDIVLPLKLGESFIIRNHKRKEKNCLFSEHTLKTRSQNSKNYSGTDDVIFVIEILYHVYKANSELPSGRHIENNINLPNKVCY